MATEPHDATASENVLFRLFVESVRDYSLYVLSPQGFVITWNEGARRIKGYEASEIIGQPYERFFTPEDRAAGKPRLLMETALRERTARDEGWRLRKDGSRFWASAVITALVNDEGVLQGFAKVTHDETKRYNVERELRQSEERFRLAISALKEHSFYLLSPQGIIESWNEGAQRIKGYQGHEIIGRHFSIFFTDDDRVSGKPMRELEIAAKLGAFEEQGWRVRKDGSRFWASVVVTAVFDDKQVLRGFTKVTRDETAKHRASIELSQALERARAAETQLREHAGELEKRVEERTALLSKQAEQLQRINSDLEQFAYVTSHDLREPLRMITNYLDLIRLRNDGAFDEKSRSYFDYIITSARRMQEMIEAVLEYARTEETEAELSVVPSAQLVQAALDNLRETIAAAGATVTVAEPLPVIRANAPNLTRVFQNLIANAVKFRSDRPCQVCVGVKENGSEWVFSVADNGIGIDPAFHQQVFKIFHRVGLNEVSGSGIGLATCKKIVERHGGRIWVESALGTGTTVHFSHPRES
jgi:PAS domain S-box-containing protein